jgi:hypothetical protein
VLSIKISRIGMASHQQKKTLEVADVAADPEVAASGGVPAE